jgi:hypothetical protein
MDALSSMMAALLGGRGLGTEEASACAQCAKALEKKGGAAALWGLHERRILR